MWVGTGGEQGWPSSAARSKVNHEGEGCRNEHQLPQWVPGELEARSPSLVEVEVAAALGWGWGWVSGGRGFSVVPSPAGVLRTTTPHVAGSKKRQGRAFSK